MSDNEKLTKDLRKGYIQLNCQLVTPGTPPPFHSLIIMDITRGLYMQFPLGPA